MINSDNKYERLKEVFDMEIMITLIIFRLNIFLVYQVSVKFGISSSLKKLTNLVILIKFG